MVLVDLSPAKQPLLVTADDELVERFRLLAAAAGVQPVTVSDAGEAVRRWHEHGALFVGADLAGVVAAANPPRRSAAHVIGIGSLSSERFRDAMAVGAETVVELPESEGWLLELLTDLGDGRSEQGLCVGVIGGAGGVGASVFAAALARRAAERSRTVLVDLDVVGAGVEHVLGLERAPGTRWDGLVDPTGRLSARSIREALPSDRELWFLGFGDFRPRSLPAFAVREVLSASRRAFSYTVLDLPRVADDGVRDAASACDLLAVVGTLTVPAVTAAARIAERVPASVPAGFVARRVGGMDAREVSRMLRLPLLHDMPSQRGLDEAVALGAGPVRSRRSALSRAADDVLDALAALRPSAARDERRLV